MWMARWIRIAAAKGCPPGQSLECVAEGRIVALFNVDGAFYAMDGICPHQGGPLAKGCLDGFTVACPWHGWQFDVATGRHRSISNLALRCYPIRLEDGEVFADLEGGL